jgi:predicted nucleic acid-binding protein
VLGLLETGAVALAFDLATEQRPVRNLVSRYSDVPMSLADACLVRMSELVADGTVFTLDGDFRIYRRHGRHVIPVLMPPAR